MGVATTRSSVFYTRRTEPGEDESASLNGVILVLLTWASGSSITQGTCWQIDWSELSQSIEFINRLMRCSCRSSSS